MGALAARLAGQTSMGALAAAGQTSMGVLGATGQTSMGPWRGRCRCPAAQLGGELPHFVAVLHEGVRAAQHAAIEVARPHGAAMPRGGRIAC